MAREGDIHTSAAELGLNRGGIVRSKGGGPRAAHWLTLAVSTRRRRGFWPVGLGGARGPRLLGVNTFTGRLCASVLAQPHRLERLT